MRLTEDERTSFSRFREVSELRTQFLCEYRFYLTQRQSNAVSKASIDGTMLHNLVSTIRTHEPGGTQWMPIFGIIAVVVLGIIWIVW
ncbi:MAG: hypothetical protein C4K48_07150 [Candidatus Thorarchaeota archaeon]|nr:MAG: hypothetical protein C4K48_07150 [Candidatus Thorarchaeota archaeon]